MAALCVIGETSLLPRTPGVSHVLGASLAAGQTLRTPTTLQPLALPRLLWRLPVRSYRRRLPYGLYEAVPDFRVCGHPSGLQSTLCTLHLIRSVSSTSSTDATLGTGGWLNLTWQGLAPCKKRQASLGALTLGLSRCRKRERGTSGRWRQSTPGPCSARSWGETLALPAGPTTRLH